MFEVDKGSNLRDVRKAQHQKHHRLKLAFPSPKPVYFYIPSASHQLLKMAPRVPQQKLETKRQFMGQETVESKISACTPESVRFLNDHRLFGHSPMCML